LCERGINLDLQLARRWECLASFGRDAEAEAAWEKVQALTQSYEAAPRQHGGRHFSHASYDVWRAFGELRLRRYDVVERRVAAWIRDEPAWRLGPSFRALLDELASDGGLFVNVERGDGIRIEAAGTFRELVRYRCIFEEATNTIVAKLGANFGIVFRVLGIPIGRSLSATVNVTSGARRQSYEIAVLAGLSEHFVWKFDTPEELISGLWSFEVEAFDQGVSVGEATHTFEVVVDP